MPVYKRGRPYKKSYYEIYDIPQKPGEYRLKEVGSGNHYYIGETNNLRRRILEHKKSGKFTEDYYVEYLIAVDESSSKERRIHEQNSIAKHSPLANKSKGGEGRPVRDKVSEISISEETIDSKPMNKLSVSFRRLLSIFWRLLLLIVLSFSVFVIIQRQLDYWLLAIPFSIVILWGVRFIVRKLAYAFFIKKKG